MMSRNDEGNEKERCVGKDIGNREMFRRIYTMRNWGKSKGYFQDENSSLSKKIKEYWRKIREVQKDNEVL